MGNIDKTKVSEITPIIGNGGDLTLYRYDDIVLSEGINTITFIITEPSQAGVGALFHIDYLDISIEPGQKPFDITSITIQPAGGDEFIANIKVSNKPLGARNASIVAAFYKSNKLIDVKVYQNQAFASGEEKEFSPAFTLPENIYGYKIKAFAIDLGSIEPLAYPMQELVVKQY